MIPVVNEMDVRGAPTAVRDRTRLLDRRRVIIVTSLALTYG